MCSTDGGCRTSLQVRLQWRKVSAIRLSATWLPAARPFLAESCRAVQVVWQVEETHAATWTGLCMDCLCCLGLRSKLSLSKSTRSTPSVSLNSQTSHPPAASTSSLDVPSGAGTPTLRKEEAEAGAGAAGAGAGEGVRAAGVGAEAAAGGAAAGGAGAVGAAAGAGAGPAGAASEWTLQVVKETSTITQGEDGAGQKRVNQYVRERVIGAGSYGKVVLHRSADTGHLCAIKICRKSRLRKLRVAAAETALMDVMREVAILKQLAHPNIVRLLEVIDAPDSDKLFLVLEYVEGGWVLEGTGPPGGIGESRARRYFRDVLAGLTYLHHHNVVHGDIKPENLLLDAHGRVKICDFGVAHMFADDNDELRRSPGTPVYTAPECCLGMAYHGKVADIWALGCTLYVLLLGRYPFVGTSLSSTYDKIVNEGLWLPPQMDGVLADLLQGLLHKDPKKRMSLQDACAHAWTTRELGLLPLQQASFPGIVVNDALIMSAFSKSVATS